MTQPSYFYAPGSDDTQFASAWGAGTYGRYVECDRHGRQFVTYRAQEDVGTRYDDGATDSQFDERLACGCEFNCQQNRGEVRRFRVGS